MAAKYSNYRRTIVLLVSLIAMLMAGAARAQTRSSANRYRMMLKALEQSDTTGAAPDRGIGERPGASGEAQDGPVNPATYTLGPGDELLLTIMGREFQTLSLRVLGEGDVVMPNLGDVNVAGMSIARAESTIARILLPFYRDARLRLTLSRMRQFKVYVGGWVERQTSMLATPLDRISTIVERAGGFIKKKENIQTQTPYIRRIQVRHRDGTVDTVDLYPYFFRGDLRSNPYVRDGDYVFVTVHSIDNAVWVYGEVGLPGALQFAPGDSLAAIISYAQGFLPSAYLDSIEVSRFNQDGNGSRRFSVNCAGGHIPDMQLERGDQFFVREKPKWHLLRTIALAGEVKYPGRYPITHDSTTLWEVMQRAGGFTPEAAIEDAEFTRRMGTNVIDREFERLARMIPSEMTKEEYEYFKAKSRERPGVTVIDFKKLFIHNDRVEDIKLREEDSLYVPARRNYVSVIGRVNTPGRMFFSPNLTFEEYIQRAGGFGFRADESGSRIIKTRTGEMFKPGKSESTIEPGDTIFVPEEPETNLWPAVLTSLAAIAQVASIVFGVYAISRK
jgi:protein involved in polysaccharide export with SLBB domain